MLRIGAASPTLLWSRFRQVIRLTTVFKLFVTGFLLYELIVQFGQYSASDEFFLIVKSIALDTWYVLGGLSCSTIQFQSSLASGIKTEIRSTRSFDEEYGRRFHSADVIQWKDSYLRQCSATQKTLSAVLSSGHLTSPGVGLTASINFALSMLFLSLHSTTPRKFQLLVVDWNYVSWTALFRDFSFESRCPMVKSLDFAAFQNINRTSTVFHLTVTGDGRVDSGQEPNLLREINHEDWIKFYADLHAMQWLIGVEEAFRRKSVMTRALLDLEPGLKGIVKGIWTELTNGGTQGYSAVHIRRGDKIAMHESIPFPILLYNRALRRLCRSHPGRCSRTVYVFCDDPLVCQNFQNLSKNCFHVTTFRAQVNKAQILPWYNATPISFESQPHFNKLPESDRLNTAKELLVSIFLAALSDFVVCTYSSNICRLVALLRSNELNRVDLVSLDSPQWKMD